MLISLTSGEAWVTPFVIQLSLLYWVFPLVSKKRWSDTCPIGFCLPFLLPFKSQSCYVLVSRLPDPKQPYVHQKRGSHCSQYDTRAVCFLVFPELVYCFVHIFLFFFFPHLMKLQTLPVQGEAKKVMVSNTFSFPSTCLRQTYRITSMLKKF